MQMQPHELSIHADSIPTAWLEEYTSSLTTAAETVLLDTISPLLEQAFITQWELVAGHKGSGGKPTKAIKQAKLHLYQLQHMEFILYLRKHNHIALADLLTKGNDSDEY